MADELEHQQDRSLPPTARRLERAREEGEVPRSRELASFVLFAALALGLWWGGPGLASGLVALVGRGLTIDARSLGGTAAMGEGLAALTWSAVLLVGPILLLLLAVAFAGPLLLGGWLLSPRALLPRLSRLDPVRGLSNVASRRALLELVKALVQAGVVLAIAGWVVAGSLEESAVFAGQPVDVALAQLAAALLRGLLALVAGLALLAAAGVPLALWKHRSRLRMTPDEFRRELKETEGDPHLRARVRAQQRDAARGRAQAIEPVGASRPPRGGARGDG